VAAIADHENATHRGGKCAEPCRAGQNEHQHDLITRRLDWIRAGEA
jgi:hypothetical protein